MATKPTKQQVAQAKARAGGNNPVKVTNAELKKLASGALIAASFIPVGRGVKAAGTAAKVAGKVAKEVASSPKIVRKIQGKQMVKQTKKAVNAVADIQQKVKAETIAKNSVKTVKADPLSRASKNIKSNEKVQNAKSGTAAKRGALDVKQSKPAKVVQVNSVVKAKSPDAAKSANAKALKAANKKGK